jgi:tetratricopeptide (TPR) repeat protein
MIELSVAAAEDLLALGNHVAAYEAYRRLTVAVLQEDPRPPSVRHLEIVEKCADLAEALGEFYVARPAYAWLLERYRLADNAYAYDYTCIRLARVLSADGRPEEAEDALAAMQSRPGVLSAAECTPAGLRGWEHQLRWNGIDVRRTQLTRVEALCELGRCKARSGRYAAAIAAFDRGLDQCAHQTTWRAQNSDLLLELAYAHLERGAFEECRAALARLPIEEADVAVAVRSLEIETAMDLLTGQLGRAVRRIEQAAQLLDESGLRDAAAREWANLASVLISLNQLARASAILDDLRLAPEAKSPSSEKFRLRIDALRGLATLRARPAAPGASSAMTNIEMWQLRTESDHAEAPMAAQPANIVDASPSGGFLARFEIASLGVYERLGNHDSEGAAAVLLTIELAFAPTDSPLIHAKLRALKGLLAYYRGDLSAARASLLEASDAFDSMGDLYDGWQCDKTLSWVFLRSGNVAAGDRERRRSDAKLERLTASLNTVDGAAFSLNKWLEHETHLSAELRKLIAMQESVLGRGGALGVVGRPVLLQQIDRAMQFIDDHRRYAAKQLGLPAGSGSGLGVLNLIHTRRKPVLRFVVLADRLVAVMVNGWRVRVLESAITRAGLRAAVTMLHANLRNAGLGRDIPMPVRAAEITPESSRTTVSDLLREIAGFLRLRELLEGLDADTELRILPDDCLHGIPFAALPVGDGVCLVDRFPLSIGSEWRAPAPAARTATGATAFVVALAYRNSDLPHLPGALVEADRVAKALCANGFAVSRLPEEDATREAVLDGLATVDVAHIACHGTFVPDDPAKSGLYLAGGSDSGRVLTILDLHACDLSGLDHIAITACWGADDYVAPGRYMIGLPETLLGAGARTVLASLWPVDDATAPELLDDYYRLIPGNTPAQALRRAQQELRVRPGCAAWYYWAGYRVYENT